MKKSPILKIIIQNKLDSLDTYAVVDFERSKIEDIINQYKVAINNCNSKEEKEMLIKTYHDVIKDVPIIPLNKQEKTKITTMNTKFNIFVVKNLFSNPENHEIQLSNEIIINKNTKLKLTENKTKSLQLSRINIILLANKLKEQIYECFEFVPYKKIGPFQLDKDISVQEFKPTGVRFLYENSINHVLNRTMSIENPDSYHHNMISKVYIKYNDYKVRITCNLNEMLNNFKKICNDIHIVKKENNISFASKTLGISGYASDINGHYYIQSIVFHGKNSYNQLQEFNSK